MIKKTVRINGTPKTLVSDGDVSLADVLREQFGPTGTKVGCGKGQCGACSVILNGKPVKSCLTKLKNVPESAEVITVEGIGTPDNLHPIQLAFTVHGAAQCGFCTPGFVVSAKALLDGNPAPTRVEVRDWFRKHRNACRCNGYKPFVDGVMDAARVIRGEMTVDDLAFKIPEDGRIWGSKFPRPSATAKVTGTLDYGADLGVKMPPGTLRPALVQAKVSHAKILSIDTSEAEKMPGVEKVVTHKDVKGKNRITGLITFPTNKGDGWDRPVLCDEKVFQFGDAIAVVCADTEANARAAAEKVKVVLEELPAYMSAPEAMAEVTVDIATGKTKVDRYTCAADIGSINSRLNVDGRIYGGVAQGIGLALSEDFEDLEKHTSLVACGLPYIDDIPDDLEIMYIENPREHGPFGAAGVGELPLTSSHVAVANAIYNATGVRIRELPALPEKVLAGIEAL
jgi:aldehyde oxidoreductase